MKRDRKRETERQRDRERETERQTERDRERDRVRQTARQTDRDRDRQTNRQTDRPRANIVRQTDGQKLFKYPGRTAWYFTGNQENECFKDNTASNFTEIGISLYHFDESSSLI